MESGGEGSRDGDRQIRARQGAQQLGRGRAAGQVLPQHAAHPALRGEGRPDVRHGPHRRLLPSLYRPGSGGGGHAGGARAGRRGDHELSRPRPHARDGHGPEGRARRAHRPARRLFQGQGRLDAHVQPREEFLRRPRYRGRPGADRNRPRLRLQVPGRGQGLPHLSRRRRHQPGPGLRILQHGVALASPGHLRDREQQVRHGHLDRAGVGAHRPLSPRRRLRHSRRAGRRHGRGRGQGGGRKSSR